MTSTIDDTSPTSASALPARRPGARREAAPRPADPPGDPLDRAWDLLAETCELPATEHGLLKVLTVYRKALHALATHVQATQRAQQPPEPGTPPGHAGTDARNDREPSHDHG